MPAARDAWLRTPPEEPGVGRWAAVSLDAFVDDLLARRRDGDGPDGDGRPLIVAIDGRSGSGKSTLATALTTRVPASVVVHTDDVAWGESFFGWDNLMSQGVLLPVRRGQPVTFRPPAWEVRRRPGAIEVATGTPLVVVEGVGASRLSLAQLLDGCVWVQSDAQVARRRGLDRDISLGREPAEAEAFWDEWMAQEEPFLAADRPWERADTIVCGTPDLIPVACVPADEILLASA
jgi:hypothetical protein